MCTQFFATRWWCLSCKTVTETYFFQCFACNTYYFWQIAFASKDSILLLSPRLRIQFHPPILQSLHFSCRITLSKLVSDVNKWPPCLWLHPSGTSHHPSRPVANRQSPGVWESSKIGCWSDRRQETWSPRKQSSWATQFGSLDGSRYACICAIPFCGHLSY